MYHIQVLGASYGSLLASRLLLAGHRVSLVCTQIEADLINSEGFRVRIPTTNGSGPVELFSKDLPGKLVAITPENADPALYDLVVLAMQEPQYGAPELRTLLEGIAIARVPCLSIMNMPPLPFLARFSKLNVAECVRSYTDSTVWAPFDAALVTHCSADPQAVRAANGALNELDVRLATNFRAAPFEQPSHNAILKEVAESVELSKVVHHGLEIQPPVKLRVHASHYVGLSKLPMLITGNYRCFSGTGIRSIQEAVHDDVELSREVYESVCEALIRLGNPVETLVPFDKYAAAAESLTEPSSAAKAVNRGSSSIERVDRLVYIIAQQQSVRLKLLEEIVSCVDCRLEANQTRKQK